jgi:myosin heavy subunit
MGLLKSPVDSIKIEEFPYLQKSELSKSFMKMYDEMMDSFQKTGFEQYEVKSLYNVLAAILHLGGVMFDDSKFDENST